MKLKIRNKLKNQPIASISRSLVGLSVVFVLMLVVSCKSYQAQTEQLLDSGWILEASEFTPAIAVKVPGLVHTDLFQAGLIPDPFYGANESDLQWIGEMGWTYSLRFVPDESLFIHEYIDLLFEGLDTYSIIRLNGQELLQTNNMYKAYRLQVKDLLKADTNILELGFSAVYRINKLKSTILSYRLPEERAFTRKAPYHLGWDWGPEYATMGIWKPVKLIGWSGGRILSPAVHTLALENNTAFLELLAEVELPEERHVELVLYHDNHRLIKQKFTLGAGTHSLRIPFEIENPELWWPNGMGAQNMYNFRLELKSKGQLFDKQYFQTGIRTFELVQNPDEIGSSFHFDVNGQAFFSKGANYIPEDHFPVRYSREKTRALLTDAAAVHMNMVRIWGGGIYPSDDFYELCDSLGLLVWQDFMFACTMYPFDDSFLENVKEEAVQQIRRLRVHPSLALWCGNNEVSEGFHNWGWQRDLEWSAEAEAEIWEGYQKLFEGILPEAVAAEDHTRPYWPSSPSLGWGRAESLELGDVHYWGVWWGEEPFEVYEQKLGRFHSEYGFQAMPALASLEKVIPENELFIESEVMEAHQKHPRGTKLIREYMERDFPVPEDLNEYIYMSQLTQAYGITKAIEAHRRNKPITMGTLYWQLNDSWPVVSWSSIDYYGQWKALHYHLKASFAPLLLSVDVNEDLHRIKGVNDSGKEQNMKMLVELKDFDGSIIRAYQQPVSLPTDKAEVLFDFKRSSIADTFDLASLFLDIKLLDNEQIQARKLHYFAKPKDLNLLAIEPDIEMVPYENYIELRLKCKQLVKNIYLLSNDPKGRFSDNFFDMVPGNEYRIRFYPGGDLPISSIEFDVVTMNAIAME